MKIYVLMTQLTTVLAIYFLHLADLWMGGNVGINPFASIPAACILLAAPYFLRRK